MPSDDIVQEVSGASGPSPGDAGAPAGPPVAEPGPAAPSPARNFVTALSAMVAVGSWFGAAALLIMAPDYPPNQVYAGGLVIAGCVILPPVVRAGRRMAPALGALWLPPLAFVLVFLLAVALARSVEPHGAARQAYIARALAAADRALKDDNPSEANRRMSVLTDDAATNPAVKAMLARIDAQSAADIAPKPPLSPAEANAAKLAELKRVDDAFSARDLACEQALDQFSATQDRVVAYQAAVNGDIACGDRFSRMPSAFSEAVPPPLRDKLNGDLKACGYGYDALSYGMSKIAHALDGNARASIISAGLFELRRGRDLLNDCLPQYEADLASAGLQKPQAPAQVVGRRARRHALRSG